MVAAQPSKTDLPNDGYDPWPKPRYQICLCVCAFKEKLRSVYYLKAGTGANKETEIYFGFFAMIFSTLELRIGQIGSSLMQSLNPTRDETAECNQGCNLKQNLPGGVNCDVRCFGNFTSQIFSGEAKLATIEASFDNKCCKYFPFFNSCQYKVFS